MFPLVSLRGRLGWLSAGNLLLALLYCLFVRVSLAAALRGDLGALLLALQELCIVGLALTRRRTDSAERSDPAAVILAWSGTIMPLLLRPAATGAVLSGLGTALQLLGGLLALAATLRLGRSFGIAAANRGVQTGGLYRLVRHPIYAAYLLVFGGFVLAHPSSANGLVLAGWFVVQLLRIRAEERLLQADPAYQSYAARVRYRLLPGVW